MQVATYKKQILQNGRNVLDEEVVYKKDLQHPAVISASVKEGNAPVKKVVFHLEGDDMSIGKKRKIQYTPHPRKRRHTHHRKNVVGKRHITRKNRH